MRVIFAITHLGFLRNFESTIALLAARGHSVHVVSDRRSRTDANDVTPIVERLTSRYGQALTWEVVAPDKRSRWHALSGTVREALNYWRYLAPAFDDAPLLRARGRNHAPAFLAKLTDMPVLRSQNGVRILTSIFRYVERACPVRDEVDDLIARSRPDVLLVTPLLYFGSRQVDYVRATRRRGIPSILGVGSWDHLTTKGMMHELPDHVLVWNELQRQEAVDLHGISAARVTATGAQAYDHWFAISPSCDRAAFCGQVGVASDRPYFLYLCSSPFIAPREVDVVRRWVQAVRGSTDRAIREAGILVRPHPQNAAQWAEVDLSEFGNLAIWPRAGANPIGVTSRQEYYDSMHHAHAVVGVNTSALIESGIVGRAVFSFRTPEMTGTQEGTLHFRHLQRGGLLRLADSLEEHVVQLARSIESVDADRARVREFVKMFVRPHGLDMPATPRVVDAIEQQAARRLAPRAIRSDLRMTQGLLSLVLLVASPIAKVVSAGPPESKKS